MIPRDRPANALSDVEDDVRKALWEWEAGDELPSDGAKRIVALVLRHKRLKEAMTHRRRALR